MYVQIYAMLRDEQMKCTFFLIWIPSLVLSAWGAGDLDARTAGPPCPQLDRDNAVVGEEDCLYLNVFFPDSAVQTDACLAHGGAVEQGRFLLFFLQISCSSSLVGEIVWFLIVSEYAPYIQRKERLRQNKGGHCCCVSWGNGVPNKTTSKKSFSIYLPIFLYRYYNYNKKFRLVVLTFFFP